MLRFDEKLNKLDSRVSEQLSFQEKQIMNHKQITVGRLTELHAKVAALENSERGIQTLATKLRDAMGTVDMFVSRISKLEEMVLALAEKMQTLESLKSAIKGVELQIDEVKGEMRKQSANIFASSDKNKKKR